MNTYSTPSTAEADEEITLFRESVARFLGRHAPAENIEQWRRDGKIPRSLWNEAAGAGYLGLSISAEFGGAGGDFRHEAALIEEIYGYGLDAFGVPLHNAIVAPYIETWGTEEQKRRWLPRMVSGELIGAIAMSEPAAGSDLQGIGTTAARDGEDYIISGQKTFVTNGQTANLIAVVVKTDPGLGAKGTSIIMVETDGLSGFERGRNLHKLGLEAADTSELFFGDVRVSNSNLLGSEGQGFAQLMTKLPQERLMIAVQGVATMERAVRETVAYVRERKAFGKPIADFQNTQFKLAECKTRATVGRVLVDHCIRLHVAGALDATMASMAKLWVTDTQCSVVDECLQLFGGYGYMDEYPISRMFRDSRVQRIYGGTNEIMKLLIARSL